MKSHGYPLPKPLKWAFSFLLILTVFSVAGCANPLAGPADSQPAEEPPAEPFQLTASELRPLTLSGEVSSVRYPIADQQISLPALGFSLDLSFNQPVDFTGADTAVVLKGPEVQYTVGQYEAAMNMDNVINVFCARGVSGRIYPGD